MDFGFLENSMKKSAFSKRPFSILDHREKDAFTSVMEILLLETGDRKAWEQWQEQQLAGLISYAKQRSRFWRNRAGLVNPTLRNLKHLPILSRKDVTEQVSTEGALLTKADNIEFGMSSTSGSTGTPVKFYAANQNAKYNAIRVFAQEILEQQDLEVSSVKIDFTSTGKFEGRKKYFEVSKSKGRFGPLASVFEEGRFKQINCLNADDELLKELRKQAPHTIISVSNAMDYLLDLGGIALLKELGVKRWIQFAEPRSSETDRLFKDAGIAISANYSSEETGPIAFECSEYSGQYHVAISNVIVETDDSLTTEVDGETLSRVLVTVLNSYATPFIRYDIGDFAKLSHSCKCGHDGPTLSHIYGRAKRFIHLPDGRYIPLQFRAKNIFEQVDCTEFQIHQKDLNTIVIHIGGRESVTKTEEAGLKKFIRDKTGADLDVEIRPVLNIDWRGNPKQLGFTSAVG